MSILEVLEIGFETGLEVLKGEKTIAEGMETVFDKTGGSQKSEDEYFYKKVFLGSTIIPI